MEVKITGPALRRLDQIDEYYSEEGFQKHGTRLRSEIIKAAGKLKTAPQLGQKEGCLERLGQDHRYILVKPSYKLIYLIKGEMIYIVDVFDTRRDPSKMRG